MISIPKSLLKILALYPLIPDITSDVRETDRDREDTENCYKDRSKIQQQAQSNRVQVIQGEEHATLGQGIEYQTQKN